MRHFFACITVIGLANAAAAEVHVWTVSGYPPGLMVFRVAKSEAEAKAQAGFADKNPVKVVECRNSGWFAEVRDEYQYVQTPGAPPRRHTFAGACGKKSRDEAFDAAWKSCRSKGGCNLNVEDMTSLVNVFVATGFDRDGVAEQGSASKAMINKDSGPGRAVYINSYCHGANEVVGLASCFAGRN